LLLVSYPENLISLLAILSCFINNQLKKEKEKKGGGTFMGEKKRRARISWKK
jgi:hypothetical protein